MIESLAPPLAAFIDEGYAVVQRVLSPTDVETACAAAADLFSSEPKARAGVREPHLRSDVLRKIASLPAVTRLATDLLGPAARVVRSILFDKTPDTNWDVVWHQDITIAVREKNNVPGFGPWSTKAGVISVQPPASVLERMLTMRIHLDDCGPHNGPLLVLPGSHRRGFIPVQTLDTAACDRDAIACVAAAGDAVLMRPLTLHASKKSQIVGHRRVLHLDFAANALPAPLAWASTSFEDIR